MRREGYELAVSKPEVILHKDENGHKVEPIEEVVCLAPEGYSGTIINKLNLRKGVMQDMSEENGYVKIVYTAPTRGLLGFRSEFINDTHGEGTLVRRISGYEPDVYKRQIEYWLFISLRFLRYHLNSLSWTYSDTFTTSHTI